jgi:hypothetical protein
MHEIAEQGCHDLDTGRKRAFIFGRYERDEHGEWSVKLPRAAPCSCGKGDCRIWVYGTALASSHNIIVLRTRTDRTDNYGTISGAKSNAA